MALRQGCELAEYQKSTTCSIKMSKLPPLRQMRQLAECLKFLGKNGTPCQSPPLFGGGSHSYRKIGRQTVDVIDSSGCQSDFQGDFAGQSASLRALHFDAKLVAVLKQSRDFKLKGLLGSFAASQKL